MLSATYRHRIAAFCAAFVAGTFTAVVMMFRAETAPILFMFGLLFAAIPALVIALPIVLILHRFWTYKSARLFAWWCGWGVVFSLLNAVHIHPPELTTTGQSYIPVYGVLSQSTLVAMASFVIAAVVYWLVAFGGREA